MVDIYIKDIEEKPMKGVLIKVTEILCLQCMQLTDKKMFCDFVLANYINRLTDLYVLLTSVLW